MVDMKRKAMLRELKTWLDLGKGFLRSSKRHKNKTSGTYMTIDEAVEEVQERTGVQKINFLGHSFGGMLVLDYALDNPQNVKELLLVATPVQGTYGIVYSNALRLFGMHDPVVYDMLLPWGEFPERLRYKMYRQWKDLVAENVAVTNVVATEDEFVGKERMSLLQAIGKRENIEELEVPEGHCRALTARVVEENLHLMMDNGAMTLGVHPILYDDSIFTLLKEHMSYEQRQTFYTFNYDFHKVPETRYH